LPGLPGDSKISALVAGPPSPESPGREFPATRVSVPLVSSLNTQYSDVKYTLPAASVATPWGSPIDVFNAAAGVGGGVPPAMVEITYCCATAIEAISRKPNRRTPEPPLASR
jgi:hypothetical protein